MRTGRRTALSGALAALWLTAGFGCDGALEARRAALCRRAVPALAPTGAPIEVLQVSTASGAGRVRVDYRLSGPLGEANRPRSLTCGFGPGTDLVSLATERGVVNGASLYLLKRYYLESPEAEAADPGGR